VLTFKATSSAGPPIPGRSDLTGSQAKKKLLRHIFKKVVAADDSAPPDGTASQEVVAFVFPLDIHLSYAT
jgi:hypothetical protein